MMDLSAIPIIDHHAHSLYKREIKPDVADFQQWFTESIDPEIHARHAPNTLFFRSGLRWLSEMLDCEPDVAAVLKARASQSYQEWTQRLFKDANIAVVLCDYGFGDSRFYAHAELKTLLPCRVEPILRLETLAEDLISEHETFDRMLDAYADTLSRARANGYVALKSIIAYRSGLDILAPARDAAAAAFHSLKETARRAGQLRLAHKPLCDYLIWLALEAATNQELPVQFHTGFGDRDAELRSANPLHLRFVIENTRCPIILLHAGWPFYRESAHLAAIYRNVWLDLSLAIPFATTGIPEMLREILGMAPLSKILFATDAFTLPEIYWLAARWGRWGLSRVLSELVADNILTDAEAYSAAEAILGKTAGTLYNL